MRSCSSHWLHFSCAWHWFLVFPRLTAATCFSAHDIAIGCMFPALGAAWPFSALDTAFHHLERSTCFLKVFACSPVLYASCCFFLLLFFFCPLSSIHNGRENFKQNGKFPLEFNTFTSITLCNLPQEEGSHENLHE